MTRLIFELHSYIDVFMLGNRFLHIYRLYLKMRKILLTCVILVRDKQGLVRENTGFGQRKVREFGF